MFWFIVRVGALLLGAAFLLRACSGDSDRGGITAPNSAQQPGPAQQLGAVLDNVVGDLGVIAEETGVAMQSFSQGEVPLTPPVGIDGILAGLPPELASALGLSTPTSSTRTTERNVESRRSHLKHGAPNDGAIEPF